MRLYLVRHGKAEKKSPTGRDEDRPLQPRGERQSRWLGETLLQAPVAERPSLILTSPAVRAHETAKLIRELLQCAVRVENALQLGEPAEDALEMILRAAQGPGERLESLMLIGHNPMMEILLPGLVAGLSPEESEMRTGESAVIDVPESGPIEERCRLIARMRYPD